MNTNNQRSGQATVQEFNIIIPKNGKKKYNAMRFNGNLNVDFSAWSQVKLERENNIKEYRGGADEDMPKFGAGSEFGREAKEEARRKKFGIVRKKYRPEDQPWLLRSGGKTGKKFKGIRDGGISENVKYYVFKHGIDGGSIEGYPLNEWYNFHSIHRYKSLSFEEAEEEFNRRSTRMNLFNIMTRKKMKIDEEVADDETEKNEGGKGKKPAKGGKSFRISDKDEWMNSDEEDSDSNNEDKNQDDDDGPKKKKKGASKKKKKNSSDDEAFEESDDGDEEGRECDYMSDSSESEVETSRNNEIKSVGDEDGLRRLLTSDEDDDEEKSDKNEEEDKNDNDDNDKDEKEKDKSVKEGDKKKDKKKKKKQSKKKDKKSWPNKDSSSDMSSDSDSDSDMPKDKESSKKSNSAHSSRSATPTPATSAMEAMKRKQSGSPDLSQAKKSKLENFNLAPSSYIPGASESGITEDAVRRYLMRKPMTTTELLQKFKSKKTGLSSDQLVNIMTQILKKINPTKQTIKTKMYLSIKAQPN